MQRSGTQIELHLNARAGRGSCVDLHSDEGIAYAARIAPLRPGTYTVHIDHALASSSPGTPLGSRTRLDHYHLVPVRVRVR